MHDKLLADVDPKYNYWKLLLKEGHGGGHGMIEDHIREVVDVAPAMVANSGRRNCSTSFKWFILAFHWEAQLPWGTTTVDKWHGAA